MKKALLSLAFFLAIVLACRAEETIDALQKAATQGHSDAQYKLGIAYYNGEGVTQNLAEAVQWWEKAAVQGDVHAECEMGSSYANGQGVKQNSVLAVQWWRKAAEQGSTYAQCKISYAYAHGDGVLKDLVESHAWSNIASAFGEKAAAEFRDDLEKEMTKEQIAEATKRAREIMATIKK